MDEAEGGAGAGGYGDGGDPVDQFHRNEAISAIVDEGFLGEEDDDYEDLYNDVNVGEGFLQSLRKNEELGFRNEEENRTKPQDPPAPSVQVATQTGSPPARIPRANGGEGERKYERDVGTGVAGSENGSRVSGVRLDGYQSQGLRGDDMGVKGPAQPVSGGSGVSMVTGGVVGGGYSGGLRVELGLLSSKVADVPEEAVNNSMSVQGMQQQQQQQTPHAIGGGNVRNEGMLRQSGGAGNMNRPNGNMVGVGGGGHVVAGGGSGGGGGGGGSGTILFVGDLHWWTTDAELEAELVKYGPVKEVKFFDEKASGKSKGYCQVEFYDLAAASACKERMNGHMFNGRPCVVAFASPFTVKRMGEAQVNRNQQMSQQPVAQARRGPNDAVNKPVGSNISTGGNYQGGDNNRGYGRGNWGRGNAQGMGNRGPVGPARNRPGGMGGRGITGDGGNGFGQAMGTPPLMHPQAMMGQGFDPAFGGPLGRMGTYGGYLGAPAPPFSGILSSFPPVGGVGLPGVAPHVNPAFFGRCMPMNGMGMVPNSGVDGPTMGMWSDPNMGGWVGDEHGGRAAESSYGEEAVTDHQYGGEASHKRGAWSNSMKEKDRGERDWSGSSDKRYREDRDPGYDREMPREKDMIHDHDWPDRRHRHDRDIGRDRDRDHERSRDRDHERERDRDRDRERERERDRHRDDRDRYADQHKYRDREPRNDGEWERDTRRGLTPNPGSLRRKSSVQD